MLTTARKLVAARREAEALREALEAVMRGINTAPSSTWVSLPTRELAVRAPHLSWRPLANAMVDAQALLDGLDAEALKAARHG